MASGVDEMIKQAEVFSKQGRRAEELELLKTAFADAERDMLANPDRIRDLKQANLWLADLAERVAKAAMCQDSDECKRYCDKALQIIERYTIAGQTDRPNQSVRLYLLRGDCEQVLDSAIQRSGKMLPADEAWGEMDEAADCCGRNDFRAAYQHLLKAKELLHQEVVIRKYTMHRAALIDCHIRIAEILSLVGDPTKAVESCRNLMQWIAKLIDVEGCVQYARFYYLCWYFMIVGMSRGGARDAALDESLLCRNALRTDVTTNRRDDLVPLESQFEGDFEALFASQ